MTLNNGGNDLTIDSATIAVELGIPQYDDVANAPQTQGRLVYATGNGTSAAGVYKHDGTSYSQVGGSGGGVDVENTDGSTLVANASAIQAGTDLDFTDDTDGTATLDYTGSGGGVTTDSVTASGDGATTTFSLSHSLGSTPAAANVQATSEDASTDFWVSNKTSTAVEITFAAAPPSGTDNLSWDVMTA